MENVSYIGLSQQIALHRLMDVTANNMANMNTPGFKSQNVLFKEYLNKPQEDGERVSQVQDYGTYRDLTQGALTHTSNQLDLAIQGEGYFAVQTAQGVRYTRDGSFSLNNQGEIVTKAGHKVLSNVSGPLIVQPGATHISITEGGTVSTEKGLVGKMKLATFENQQTIIPIGDNLYYAQDATELPSTAPVKQGMIETSNVQPVLEMNKMIEILRMYQAAQNMLVTDHERIRSMVQRLTRV
jgi:flagellar basal-body rod protein FlgF